MSNEPVSIHPSELCIKCGKRKRRLGSRFCNLHHPAEPRLPVLNYEEMRIKNFMHLLRECREESCRNPNPIFLDGEVRAEAQKLYERLQAFFE